MGSSGVRAFTNRFLFFSFQNLFANSQNRYGQIADFDACSTSRRALTPSSRSRAPAARAAYLTRHRPCRLGRRRLHHHVLWIFRAPCGPPMTPFGLLGSLGPSRLAFTLHRPGPSAWTFRFTTSLLTFILHHGPSAWIFCLTFTSRRRPPCCI